MQSTWAFSVISSLSINTEGNFINSVIENFPANWRSASVHRCPTCVRRFVFEHKDIFWVDVVCMMCSPMCFSAFSLGTFCAKCLGVFTLCSG